MLPWVQRKLMVMYDINIDEKKKIESIIKKYLLKWGSENEIHIFTFIADILLASDDTVINKIDITTEFDDDLKDEIELANSSFSGSGITITYDHVNKEPVVEKADEEVIVATVNNDEPDDSSVDLEVDVDIDSTGDIVVGSDSPQTSVDSHLDNPLDDYVDNSVNYSEQQETQVIDEEAIVV